MNKQWRLPAEWEPQSMIQLTWPHKDTDWAPYLAEITHTYVELVKAIIPHEKVLIVAQEPEEVKSALSNAGVQLSAVMIFACPTNDTWARDHGLITLVKRQETKDKSQTSNLHFLNFQFNGWGGKFPAEKDNAINQRLTEAFELFNLQPSTSNFKPQTSNLNFILEGGSIESDGKGTIFTTSQCLLAPHRNQPLTKAEIEERLKEYLCAERVIWLDHGTLIGDDTDGHIDTIVRIAPADTLLYIGCDQPEAPQYEDFKALESQLMTLRTLEGNPYRLLCLPMPHAIVDEDGDHLPATYANFLIINEAVLVPTYAQPDKDRQACEIIQTAFPDRHIIPIDARTIIRQHGSIHCCAMQFPDSIIMNNPSTLNL